MGTDFDLLLCVSVVVLWSCSLQVQKAFTMLKFSEMINVECIARKKRHYNEQN